MVELTKNEGYTYVECHLCGEQIHENNRVWYLSITDWKKTEESKNKTYLHYESEGFCSLACLLSFIGDSIQDSIVGDMIVDSTDICPSRYEE